MKNFTFISLDIAVVVVTAVVLVLNLKEIPTGKTLLMFPLDNLHIRILLEIFILMLLAIKVVAKQVLVRVTVIAVVDLTEIKERH